MSTFMYPENCFKVIFPISISWFIPPKSADYGLFLIFPALKSWTAPLFFTWSRVRIRTSASPCARISFANGSTTKEKVRQRPERNWQVASWKGRRNDGPRP